MQGCIDGAPDPGDTTWVLLATILVLGMVVGGLCRVCAPRLTPAQPGLAFFEAGLLRSKNTLSILRQAQAAPAAPARAPPQQHAPRRSSPAWWCCR